MIFNVLGLGETLNDYKGDGSNSIGCNNIWGKVKTQYVVCVDHKKAFTPDRLQTLVDCRPEKFFTHLDEWKDHPCFNRIHLHPARGLFEWRDHYIPYSNNSASVACAIAYRYFKATEIHLYGVDFTNHPKLSGTEMLASAIRDFKLLNALLIKVGCKIVTRPGSALHGQLTS